MAGIFGNGVKIPTTPQGKSQMEQLNDEEVEEPIEVNPNNRKQLRRRG